MIITRRSALLGAAALAACGQEPQTKGAPPAGPAWAQIAQTGEGRIAVPGGNVVWRKFGAGAKTPVLAAQIPSQQKRTPPRISKPLSWLPPCPSSPLYSGY